MKIVVVGAGGDVGRSVADELARDDKHEVIRVGRTRGMIRLTLLATKA